MISEQEELVERVVVCGSFHPSNLGNILKAVTSFQSRGFEVFPTVDDMRKRLPLILERHVRSNPSEDLLKIQGVRVWEWLRKISEANLVFFANEKNDKVYLGKGATIELGFALAYGKTVLFLHRPEDDSTLAILEHYQNV